MLIKSPWGGGIISTTYDYALFLQMLMNQGHLNGKRILGRKTVELISRGLYGQGLYGGYGSYGHGLYGGYGSLYA